MTRFRDPPYWPAADQGFSLLHMLRPIPDSPILCGAHNCPVWDVPRGTVPPERCPFSFARRPFLGTCARDGAADPTLSGSRGRYKPGRSQPVSDRVASPSCDFRHLWPSCSVLVRRLAGCGILVSHSQPRILWSVGQVRVWSSFLPDRQGLEYSLVTCSPASVCRSI